MTQHPSVASGRLSARRETSVRALLEILAPGKPDAIELGLSRAAAAAVAADPAASHASIDSAVLDAARDAAAEHLEYAAAPTRGVFRRSSTACAHIPRVLAARAAGRLGADDAERLSRHLSRCASCASMAERFRIAEVAARDGLDDYASEPLHDVNVEWLVPDARPATVEAAAADDLEDGGDADDEIDASTAAPGPKDAEAEEPAKPQEPVAHTAADDWLVEDVIVAERPERRESEPEDWLADDATAPVHAGAVATPPSRTALALRGRATSLAPVLLLVVGAGAAVAVASGIGNDQPGPPPRPVVASAGVTGADRPASGAHHKAVKRPKPVKKHKRRVKHTARAPKRTTVVPARQVIATPPPAATPVAPVQRATAPAPAPVRRSAPRPATSRPVTVPAAKPTTAAAPAGPTGAAPSGESGRQPTNP